MMAINNLNNLNILFNFQGSQYFLVRTVRIMWNKKSIYFVY